MRLENCGPIGNCQYLALVDRGGSDSPRGGPAPVFSGLLDGSGGEFSITPAGGQSSRQHYGANSNISETEFETPDGRFRATDFAPRFAERTRDTVEKRMEPDSATCPPD